MKRKRHGPEQVIAKLREADVCKRLEVSEQTYHRWRNQFGGMKGPDMKRLKELERENAQLKKVVAELVLDKELLKELERGNF
ncbi:MAG: hypothetical protein EXS13_02760 [Planctomycetes bacterium]|nr:hypothetical protein [Planctomycetota bacterium]